MIEFNRKRYRVTREGYVEALRDDDTWMRLHTYRAAGNGYPTVRLWLNGKRKGYQVHRLVAQEFLPPKPFARAVLRHLDGDQTNSAASNLEWGTQSENIHEMHGHQRQRALEDAEARIEELERQVEKLERDLATALDCNSELRGRVRALMAPYHDPDCDYGGHDNELARS